MSDDLEVLDLNALVKPVARIKLDDQLYDVLPIQGDALTIFEQVMRQKEQNGTGERSVEQMRAESVRLLELSRRVVYAVAPSIPKERVATMALAQITAIVERAMGPVRTVQRVQVAAVGKDGGPAKRTRTRSARK